LSSGVYRGAAQKAPGAELGKYQQGGDRRVFDLAASFELLVSDGQLDAAALAELKRIFTHADAGHGSHAGVLNDTEIRFRLDRKQVAALLRRLDLLAFFDDDGDGEVSIEELMSKMDADGDGQLSLGEFVGAVRSAMAHKRAGSGVFDSPDY
jgi:hypothetical protein